MLKSFRDREADFPVYDRSSGADAYLQTLGPLVTPQKGSRAGVDVHDPRKAISELDAKNTADNAIPMFKGKTGTE